MNISEDIIEKVRASSDMETVIREYLPDLKRTGRNWKTYCPFHNEKTPSFILSPEKGIFRCFGCNVAGDVFKFVMLVDNVSWIESVKKLANRANIIIQEENKNTVKISEKTRLFEILENSSVFYHRCLLESASAQKARNYFEKRGITNKTINKFKLGFAPEGQLLRSALKKGYTIEDLSRAGLITKTKRGTFFEYMSERFVFPIFDIQGRVVAFGGRTIANQNPKYLNTPETIIYSKSSNLYGLFQTLTELRKKRRMIILEGYMDVVIPQQFGISGAVATLGTVFTKNHTKLISRYSDSVVLLFDSDNAGRNVTQRALETLVESGVECRVSTLPEHTDADEYINQYGKESFLKLLETSSKSGIDFMIAKLYENFYTSKKKNYPEIKAKAVSNLLDFVTKSSNIVVQREWVKNIAQCVNVNEEAVWEEFKKKQELKFKGYLNNSIRDLIPHISIAKNKKVSMSLEENLLNLVLSNNDYIERISSDCFKEIRCKKVFDLIVLGLKDAEILNTLSQEDKSWFSELTLNAIEYDNPEEAFIIILKDIEASRLEKKRQQLEKEIILMSDGKKEKNEKMFDEYKKLTSILKGSRK
jgi:DNA primase